MGRIILEAIVLLYFAMLADAKMKSVSISLKAKWSSTPFLAETSEYFFNKSGEAFWSFVEATTSLNVDADDYDEYSDYTTAVNVSSKFLTPSKLRLLKFALSTRYYSPMVQMHQEMARDRLPPGSCKAFVEVNNFVTCEVAAFKAYLKTLQKSETLILDDERIYPSRHESPFHVVLYARLGTKDFDEWHGTLAKLSDEGKVAYVFRHYFKTQPNTKCFLSGYGVELAIKSTEYKAKDDAKVEGDRAKDEEASVDEVQGFVFSTLKSLYPESTKDLQEFRQFLVDSTGDMAPLKVWQMQDLSFQVAQKVMLEPKENQLNLLKDLSQNFPSLARRLVKVAVSDGLKKGIKDNQRYLEQQHQLSPGDTAFFINGVRMDGDMFEVFSVLERIDAESDLIEGLSALGSRFGLESQQLSPLLTLELKGEDIQFGLDIRDPSVWYINDLERDQAYMAWPGSVSDLLRPTFPGMLRHIRKNLFNLVLVINPVDPKHLALVKTVEAFYSYHAPIRVGLMFVVPEDAPDRNASVALVKAFSHLYHEDSPGDAIAFLAHEVTALSVKGIDTDSVRSLLSGKFSRSTVDDMMSGVGSDDDDDDEKYNLKRSLDFYQRSGLSSLPQLLLNGVPLTQQEVEAELEDAIYQRVLRQTSDLQKFVYNGALTDKDKVIDFLMTQKNIMPRLNQRVLMASNRYLNLAQMHSPASSSIFSSPDLNSLNETSLISILSSDMKHLVKNEESKLRPMTVWVACDLEKPEGRSLFLSALKHLKHTNNMRLGLIHNVPHSSIQSKGSRISSVVQHAIESLSLNVAKNFLFKILREENVPRVTAGFKNLAEFSVGNMDMESFIHGLEKRGTELLNFHRVFCQKVLKLPSSALAVVVNGKVIGPLDENSVFVEKDFELMEKVSQAAFVEKVEKIVKSYKLEGEVTSDLVMRLESVLMSQSHRENRVQLKFIETEHSVLHIEAPEPGPTFDLVAVLDPVSRGAQKFLPIIEALSEVVNADIKIFFNCREKLSEMPLKSFYRFVLNPEPQVKDNALVAPSALFYGLPENSLLTLNMDTPESWLVEAVHSPYDLDNILLGEVESRVAAEFELEKLLLEGRCYDLVSGNPPRGLQFILGTNSTPALVDTIVMANLGYFQLKASPGLWYLRLREGKSRDLYNIVGQGAADVKDNIMVLMDSFKGVTIYPKVTKKEGMEKEDLLSDDAESSYGIWDSLSSTLGGRTSRDSEEDPTINVFSLASGHLYERFLRIMMLSVLKNTQSKVKFWFLKNYLSPSFKNFIPHMASKYNFEYELVQYKWPRWLHQQTEKQRMIWGYKILFLDVLFPLSVNKIIFVDADQTVRADLKELHDLDLEGAPYGYTPFCDSRDDMDGYRFWKSGYWQSHLGHRKYHISALYVVDLKKFRRIAAGDRLRGQYQGLSQDPNSLSNLDQDLPNNMIHQVAIKSLPQEWLWCETWCSDAEKKKAKTIDLCNNPKTKEPKLEAAMRIVGEWKDYDGEVKSLWDQVNSNVSDETTTVHTPDPSKLPHGEL